MKVVVFSFFILISSKCLYGQKWNFGLGLEVNRMNLATKAPEVKVPYTIWYNPNYGLTGMINIDCQVNDVVTVCINPSYGYYLNNWNNLRFDDSFLKINHLSLSFGSQFKLWKLLLGQDVGISRYVGVFEQIGDSSFNISNYPENRTPFFSSIYLGYNIYKQSRFYIKGTYYHDNLFISNGFDTNGKLVGPVMQRPIILIAGIKINFIEGE